MDGLHHGREMSTVAMCVYTAMHLLSDYAQGNRDTILLLSTSAVFIIPAVNYDSLVAISSQYTALGTLNYQRKNRDISAAQTKSCNSSDLFGVDLTRNYDFKFGLDEVGSSSQICSDSYRGPSAFSEAETQAIRSLLERRGSIKIAFNYHAYGNFLDIPNNYDDATNTV